MLASLSRNAAFIGLLFLCASVLASDALIESPQLATNESNLEDRVRQLEAIVSLCDAIIKQLEVNKILFDAKIQRFTKIASMANQHLLDYPGHETLKNFAYRVRPFSLLLHPHEGIPNTWLDYPEVISEASDLSGKLGSFISDLIAIGCYKMIPQRCNLKPLIIDF